MTWRALHELGLDAALAREIAHDLPLAPEVVERVHRELLSIRERHGAQFSRLRAMLTTITGERNAFAALDADARRDACAWLADLVTRYSNLRQTDRLSFREAYDLNWGAAYLYCARREIVLWRCEISHRRSAVAPTVSPFVYAMQ
ncbi:MAG: hypothetical protein HQL40_05325 [Alphaproteobacteria bacterium]|nr:hypothetical protein [Alphaproteobacteria bacterium]